MPKLSPTFYQIISTDYLAQNFFVMIFGGWVIYGIDALFEGHFTPFLLIFAALCTPIGLATFYWRYNLIVATFVNGLEVRGQIVQINTLSTGKNRKDYIIEYAWQVNGQAHQYRNRVKKNTFAQTLKPGQPVTLLVNERNPAVAFIKNIYIEFI